MKEWVSDSRACSWGSSPSLGLLFVLFCFISFCHVWWLSLRSLSFSTETERVNLEGGKRKGEEERGGEKKLYSGYTV